MQNDREMSDRGKEKLGKSKWRQHMLLQARGKGQHGHEVPWESQQGLMAAWASAEL